MRSAEYGAAGEKNTYRNQAGRGLLEDGHDMKERIKRLEDRMANIDAQIADHQAQIADHHAQIANLQDRVKTLTTDAEGYHGIRHRFIDVYRRDVLRNVTEQGRIRINKGNVAAYGGDAITDATLYTTHQRDDEDVLISLYGLTADQIWFLSKCLTS